jgi:hypothetical protein
MMDDEPWTDGGRPHRCGAYVDEHTFEPGVGFVCPPCPHGAATPRGCGLCAGVSS